MKDNSKSGLCIRQTIGVTMALIILATHIQLFVSASNIIPMRTISKETTQEGMEITQTVERQQMALSRAGQERTIEIENQETEQKYISIEEVSISKDMNLNKRCGISKEDFKILMTNLKTDTSGFFEENSDIIYTLCEKYEINEIFFCGLIAAESGWEIASNHRNTNNYISMMSKGRLIHYSSVEEGLEAAAKLLHNNYLSSDGAYYHGATLYGVQKCFCPSATWINLVYNCMEQIVK